MTWCILCNVSIAYWIFKGDIETKKEINTENFYYKFFDFLAHGIIPLIMIFDLSKYPFTYFEIIYPVILSLFWFFFVMIPWYIITNTHVYPFLNNKVPISKKIKIMSFVLFNTYLSGLFGLFLNRIIAIMFST